VCPVLATPVRAFVPDASPSLAISDRCLVFVGLDNVFFGIDTFLYDCLNRVTDEFFFAYSVLTQPKYAFVPDVRLVLAKLWLHLVSNGSDCIDFGIDILDDCLHTSSSFYSRTMRLRLPRHRHPTTTSTTATPHMATSTKVAAPNALGYPDIGTKGYHLA